jgi:hypothetical protein
MRKGKLLRKELQPRAETVAELRREFLAAVRELWPVAGGSLSRRKNSCARADCAACASGAGHPGYGLWGKSGAQRFGVYVPERLVPELEQALQNGRALQELILAFGVRYVRARKAEVTSGSAAGRATRRSQRRAS